MKKHYLTNKAILFFLLVFSIICMILPLTDFMADEVANPSFTPIVTPTVTPGVTPSPTPTVVPEVTPSITPEATPTPAVTDTPVITPSPTPSPTPLPTPIPTPTVTPVPEEATFPEDYTLVNGVLTFRGNHFRSAPAFGTADVIEKKLAKIWQSSAPGSGIWGGGSGWTGQPALVKWDDKIKMKMNIKEKFKKKENFVEVIIASLNGSIYFFDLDTGEKTREPIVLGNSIKGSVSVDARGYPLLYMGQGIREKGNIGFYIFNLYNQKILFFQNGLDKDAPRGWGAFDSSALFSRTKDQMFVGGENGLVYKLNLNTKFDIEKGQISISPKIEKYSTYKNLRGAKVESGKMGIENSLAAYKELIFFADNDGYIRCINTDLKEIWKIKNLDDTDASITVEVENDVPFLYTGCEVDKQGKEGTSRLLKINGLTGKIVWEKKFHCYSRFGTSPSNGGLLATNIIGKNDISNLVIFTLCRNPKFDTGIIVALDKKTGNTVWTLNMTTYAWPSPVDIYDKDGKSYIIQCDHNGYVLFIEGKTGKVVQKQKLDSYIEASPSVHNDTVVFASRTGRIYGLKIK